MIQLLFKQMMREREKKIGTERGPQGSYEVSRLPSREETPS